jgi:hypothetical protein
MQGTSLASAVSASYPRPKNWVSPKLRFHITTPNTSHTAAMSSMRNAVQRRNHKERAQPVEREKWGLLEKRKDYKLRAADHKQKKQKLKLLSEKARDRNPDEFSFKMLSSKVDKQGKKMADRGNVALSVDVVKLLKTQDSGYIRTMLQMVRKEREELEQKLVLEEGEIRAVRDGDKTKQSKHRVYVEDEEEQRAFDPDTWFGRGEDLPDRAKPTESTQFQGYEDEEEEQTINTRPKTLSKKQLEAEIAAKREKRAFNKTRDQAQSRTATKLQIVKKREEELAAAEEELEAQRAKMNNTVGGVNKQGVKFKVRERKR